MIDKLYDDYRMALYLEKDEYDLLKKEAYEIYEKRKEKYGEDHEDTLSAFFYTVLACLHCNDVTQGKEALDELYEKYIFMYGEKDEKTVSLLELYAYYYEQNQEYTAANEMIHQLHDFYFHKYGQNHFKTLKALSDSSYYMYKEGNASTALMAINYVLSQDEKNIEAVYRKIYYQLTLLQFDEVEKTIKLLLSLQNSDGNSTMKWRNNVELAYIYGELGMYEKALQLISFSYRDVLTLFGKIHPNTFEVELYKTMLLLETCQYEKAKEVYFEMYEHAKNYYGEHHPSFLDYKVHLTNFIKERKEALRLLEEVVKDAYQTLKDPEENPIVQEYVLLKIKEEVNVGIYSSEYQNLFIQLFKLHALFKEDYARQNQYKIDMVNIYLAAKDFDKAKVILDSMDLYGLEAADIIRFNILKNKCYATLFYQKKEYENAQFYAFDVYSSLKTFYPKSHPDTLEALYHLIQYGEKDFKYIKEFFENNDLFLTLAFKNEQREVKKEQLKMFKDVYEKAKENIQIQYYDILLKYKNLLYDVDYFTNKIHLSKEVKQLVKEKVELEQKAILLKKNGKEDYQIQIKIADIKDRIEQYFNTFDIISAFKNYTLANVQEKLHEQHMILDIYQRKEDYVLFEITKTNISMFCAKDIDYLMRQISQNYAHIYVAADGDIWQTSFEPYFENSSISYLSSVKSLLYENDQEESNTVHLVGDLIYDEKKSDPTRSGYASLLFSKDEIASIYHVLKDQKEIQIHSGQVHKEDFLNVENPSILHISSHGEFVESEEVNERGRLVLGKDEFVSAKEIMEHMNLRNTRIVSLASCYSGKVSNEEFEGVYGLLRAFELCGVKTLVVSRGAINDMLCAAFMIIFYTNLASSTSSMIEVFTRSKEEMKHLTVAKLDALFGLDEESIKSRKLGRVRKEAIFILKDKQSYEKELNKIVLQGQIY